MGSPNDFRVIHAFAKTQKTFHKEFGDLLTTGFGGHFIRLLNSEHLPLLLGEFRAGRQTTHAVYLPEAVVNCRIREQGYENGPLKEDVDAYMAWEVVPHVPDAWVDHSKTCIG